MSMEYEWVDGYEHGDYTDTMIFEVDPDTKKLQVITKQIMISGEENSQFIRFQMPRYYDGIDLSEKSIQIIYITEGGYSDINAAINVERNDENIRFGWLVPGAASYDVGILSFSLEFVGEDYVLKTRAVEVEVFDGLNGGEIIPEPEEKAWYIELQQRCDYVLSQAEDAQEAAADSAEDAADSEENAESYMTRAEAAATQLENAVTQVGTNKDNITLLSSRMDQALADYDASAETEIMDARVGADSTTYNTLGTAIRTQISDLGDEVDELKSDLLLLEGEIPDTVQSITFDQTTGNISTIAHTRNNVAIRTDVFTFGATTITETRTLNTGESLTIVTDLGTLETTVTYSAA